MGYGDPGVFGGGEMTGAPTPNIDRLAFNGLKLTSTYATPLCTPTRAALMTGRIPARSGLTRPLLASDHPTKNPWADEVSAAKLLSANGYVTGLSGKWHIGEAKGMQPQDVGYDEFHGFLSVVSEYTQYMDIAKVNTQPFLVAVNSDAAPSSGDPFRVARMASRTPMARRRAVSMTDRMSA